MAGIKGKTLHPQYHPTQPGESTAPKAVLEDGINETDEVALARVEKVYK